MVLKELKIAVIAFEFPSLERRTGGVSHFNERLCNELYRRGYDVTVYVVEKIIKDVPYKSEYMLKGEIQTTRFYRYYLAPLLARKWDFNNFDIVISTGDDWAIKRDVPWVRVMCGSSLREAQRSNRILHMLNHFVMHFFEIISVKRSSKTYFISEDTMSVFPKYPNNEVLSLPIDTTVFKQIKAKHDSPVILFVGTLEGRKRGSLLLDIFENVIRVRIPDAQLWMVSNLGRNLDGVTYFSGNLSLEKLASLYAQAHVFCLPSTYEGFGLPYLESMASGTIVVSTPNAGAIEVLGNGKYGVIVEECELAEMIVHILCNPGLYKDMQLMARERANQFSWDNIISSYLSVCEK